MFFIYCALLYPIAQRRNLFGFERLGGFRRRHAVLRISCLDLLYQWTPAGLSGNDGGTAFVVRCVGKLRSIEPQFGFSGPRIRAVAWITVFRKNGLNTSIER